MDHLGLESIVAVFFGTFALACAFKCAKAVERLRRFEVTVLAGPLVPAQRLLDASIAPAPFVMLRGWGVGRGAWVGAL